MIALLFTGANANNFDLDLTGIRRHSVNYRPLSHPPHARARNPPSYRTLVPSPAPPRVRAPSLPSRFPRGGCRAPPEADIPETGRGKRGGGGGGRRVDPCTCINRGALRFASPRITRCHRRRHRRRCRRRMNKINPRLPGFRNSRHRNRRRRGGIGGKYRSQHTIDHSNRSYVFFFLSFLLSFKQSRR